MFFLVFVPAMNWTVFLLWIVFFIVCFPAMNCVLCFFLPCFFALTCAFCYEFGFLLCFFLLCIVLFIVFFCYELYLFGVFLLWFVAWRTRKAKKHKKAHKNIRKSWVLVPWKKCKNGPPDLDSLWPSGPANVSHPFLLPTSFPRDSLRSEGPCFRGHCILKNSDLFIERLSKY